MPPAQLKRVTSPSSHVSEPSSSTMASRRKVATIPPSARFNPPTPPSSPPPTHSALHPASPVPDIDSNYDSDCDEPPPFHHLFTLGRRIRRRQTDDESESSRPMPERKESKASARLKTLGAAARGHSFSPFRRASADDARPELMTVLSAPTEDTGPSLLSSVPMAKSTSAQSHHARPLPKRAGTLDSPLQIAEGSNSSKSPRLSDQTDTTLVRPTTPPAVTRPPVNTRRTAPGKLKIPRPSSIITRGTWFDAHPAEPEPAADSQRDVFHETQRDKPRKKRRKFPQATMPPTPYNMTPRQGYWNTSNRSSLHSMDSPLGEGSSAAGVRSVADRQRRFLGETSAGAGPPSPMSQPFHSANDYGFGFPEKDVQATSSHGDGQLWRFVTCGMGGQGRAKQLRARRRRRREEKPEVWRTRVRKWFILDGYVTLYIRVVTLACAITSLVLSVQTRGLQRQIDLPGIMGASPILSLAFSVATIVHFFAVSHRELTGRPIGLWGLRSKMLWVCLDILFISFWSAYMSSAINDYIATPLECTGTRPWWRNELTDAYSHLLEAVASTNLTLPGDATPAERVSETLGIILPSVVLRSPITRGICHRQAISIGLGVVTLVLYCFNMVLSLFRIFETVRLSATGVTRSDLV